MNQAATQIVQPERGLITIQNIMPAAAANKPARIKDNDGVIFSIWPDKLTGINIGETYEIDFVLNGAYRNIKAIRIAQRPGPAPAQFTAAQPQARSLSSAATQPPNAQSNGNGQYYRPTAPRDSERMFVCSTLNAFIQTGRVDPHRDALGAAINELRAAYAATFGQDDQ
jgi:hypothetical protein